MTTADTEAALASRLDATVMTYFRRQCGLRFVLPL